MAKIGEEKKTITVTPEPLPTREPSPEPARPEPVRAPEKVPA